MDRLAEHAPFVRGWTDMKRSLSVILLPLCLTGCLEGAPGWGAAKTEPLSDTVVRVLPIYGSKPWLSFDEAGDLDPEGIKVDVYLIDRRTGHGEFGHGDILVDMYTLEPRPDGSTERMLAKQWRFGPDTPFRSRRPTRLGWGYQLHLDWRPGDYLGKSIEVAVAYERSDGRIVRSKTKRLRVPRSSRDRSAPIAASPRP